MTAHQADIIYTSLGFILPIAAVVVIRKGWVAIPLAAFSHWATVDFARRVLQQLDPKRDAGLYDALWKVFGWIQAILLVIILWTMKQCYLRLRDRTATQNVATTSTQAGTPATPTNGTSGLTGNARTG